MSEKIEYKEFKKAVASLSTNKLYTFFGIGDKQEYLKSCEDNWNKLPEEVQRNFIKQVEIISKL